MTDDGTGVNPLVLLDEWRKVVEAANGQRAMLVANGWTQEQAGDVVAAAYRGLYRSEEQELA